MTDARTLFVPDGLEGERVDAALARLFGVSRTKAADLASSGDVQVNHRQAGKSDRVSAGDLLEVALPASEQSPTLKVIAEPVPGMSIIHDVGGLAAAGYRIATSGASERQGIVSRLDVGTSGLMVVAKSEYAYSVLKQAFRSRSVDKKYHALVQGLPDPVVGTIDAPIGRHPNHDYKFAVMEKGKPSVTHYEVIEAFRAVSLLDIHLETGRTHQIRVHFSALHHPCAGDLTYGADPKLAARLGLERQWLHAVGLGFEHPGTGKHVTFESPYPADLQS